MKESEGRIHGSGARRLGWRADGLDGRNGGHPRSLTATAGSTRLIFRDAGFPCLPCYFDVACSFCGLACRGLLCALVGLPCHPSARCMLPFPVCQFARALVLVVSRRLFCPFLSLHAALSPVRGARLVSKQLAPPKRRLSSVCVREGHWPPENPPLLVWREESSAWPSLSPADRLFGRQRRSGG